MWNVKCITCETRFFENCFAIDLKRCIFAAKLTKKQHHEVSEIYPFRLHRGNAPVVWRGNFCFLPLFIYSNSL